MYGDSYSLTGFYRGQIVQHLSMGRCKIWIPGVFPPEFKEKPEMLPDAEQASIMFGGGGAGNGSYSYPNIGVTVWCFFENGEQTKPVYFAMTLGGDTSTETPGQGFSRVRENAVEDDDKSQDTTLTGQDAQQHGFVIGNCSVMMRESGQIEMEAKESAEDEDESGEDAESVPGEEGDLNHSTIKISKEGTIEVDSTVTIEIKAPDIILNGSRIQMNGDDIKIFATKQACIQAQDIQLLGQNSLVGASPSINMDASTGKFIAKGATTQPIFVT